MKRFLSMIIFILLVGGIIVGIGKSHQSITKQPIVNNEELPNEAYIDELKIPLIEVDSLNPLVTKNEQVFQVLKLIYEPLFEYASNETLEKILVQNFSKLDSKTYIMTLKPDIKWHRGGDFTSSDVAFTIQTLQEYELIFSPNVANIDRVEILDDASLKLYLREPDDFLASKLVFPIIPEYYFQGDGMNDEKKAARPCGTGLYQYKETLENGQIVLTDNYHYWNPDISFKLHTIFLVPYATYGEAIKAFKSAEIDMIVTNMHEWKEKFGTIGLNSYSFENAEWEVMIPNVQKEALSESVVRSAILRAINRENMINTVYDDNAVVSDIGVHTTSINSSSNLEYDLEKTKQILLSSSWVQDEMGWYKEKEDKIYRLEFELLVDQKNEEKMQVAEKIKSDLHEIGITIHIKPLPFDKIVNLIYKKEFDLALVSLDMKGEISIVEAMAGGSDKNYSGLHSNALKNSIEKLTINEENYQNHIEDFISIYHSELPYIGLYYKTSTLLTNKSVKGNFNPSWSNYYRNIVTFCK